MPNTVSSAVKLSADRPSGAPLALLPAMPAQPSRVEPVEAPRLVPALVDGKRIWVECPEWCTLDHVAENDKYLDDLYHAGEMADLNVPRFNEDGPLLLGFARLGIDSYSTKPEYRVPFIVLDEGAGTGDAAYMRPEQAEEFADGLVAFAEQVRKMARTIKGRK
ncbi:DUF6907 domain-containing protein [Streptomyces xanthochromogenes]